MGGWGDQFGFVLVGSEDLQHAGVIDQAIQFETRRGQIDGFEFHKCEVLFLVDVHGQYVRVVIFFLQSFADDVVQEGFQ